MSDTVIVANYGPVGILKLNRPAKRNALNSELSEALADGVAAFEADDAIRAIVIGGSEPRAFCAGADMSEAVGRLEEGGGARSQAIGRLFSTLGAARKPLIGAIEGYCFGGGAILATLLDIRIASDTATFRFPGAEYGLVVGGSSLPRLVGPALAKELILTADVIDAAEAGRIGLVNHVLPVGDVWPAAIAMGLRIAQNSAGAVQNSKQVIDRATDNAAAVELENQLNRELRTSPEHHDRFRSATHRVTGKSKAR